VVGEEDEGGAGGSRTSVVFVQVTRRVEREEEFFANYGDSFLFPHGCQCHLHAHNGNKGALEDLAVVSLFAMRTLLGDQGSCDTVLQQVCHV